MTYLTGTQLGTQPRAQAVAQMRAQRPLRQMDPSLRRAILKAQHPEWEEEGQVLKAHYQRIGLSRRELAGRAGLSPSTVARFENGEYVQRRNLVSTSLSNALTVYSYERMLAIKRLNPWLFQDIHH